MTRRLPARLLLASAATVLALGTLSTTNTAQAEDWFRVVRVEEDWELLLGDPDANSNGPQICCTISPTLDTDGLHAVFELNHRSQPEFSPGGLQLQVWNGETAIASQKFPNGQLMQHSGEVVRWTQVMQLEDETLKIKIVNGQSSTWGEFGGQGLLSYEASTELTSLNSYRPHVSVQNSGVSFAGNRVQLLVLRRVRFVLSNGYAFEDDTTRVVHILQ